MGKYLSFMDDEKLVSAIRELYDVYAKSFSSKKLKDLNKNVIDPFKFHFDTEFLYNGDAELTVQNEIFRQSDKSIANAVGVFHQKLLGAIDGFCETPDLPTDVKKLDHSIFVEVKNKHNTMNVRSAAGVYDELSSVAKSYPSAMCYLVEIISKKSIDEVWTLTVNETKLSNKRIHRISADRFYALATGDTYAFKKLCETLPVAIKDFLQNKKEDVLHGKAENKAYQEIKALAEKNKRTAETEMFNIAFSKYETFQ